MRLKIVIFFVFLVLIVISANFLLSVRILTRKPVQPLIPAAPAPQLLASVPEALANVLTVASASVRVAKSELSDATASAAAATSASIDCSLIRQQAAAEGNFFRQMGKDQCWGEKGTTQFLEFYTSLISQSRTGVFIDVGANIGGYFERMHAQLLEHPEWKVIGFEPNPMVCSKLLEHELVKQKRVLAHCLAVGASDGNVSFTDNTQRDGRHSETGHMGGVVAGVDVGPVITVPMRSLDSLSDELLKHSPIHMLKIDVEGAEGSVLNGAKQILQHTDIVVFEIGETWGHSPPSIWNVADAAQFFWEQDFLAFRLGLSQLFRFDGPFFNPDHVNTWFWGNALAVRRSSHLLPKILKHYNMTAGGDIGVSSSWILAQPLECRCVFLCCFFLFLKP
jgi:FkbM family methyltransferase